MVFQIADRPLPVLVVEDEPVMATLLRRYIESQGYSVKLAHDGAEALAMHRETPFEIVVSDWNMPSMDGATLCREFRKIGDSYVYFILCSARTERADQAEAFAAGVDDFLTKPVDRADLTTRLFVAQRILAFAKQVNAQKAALEAMNTQLQRLATTDELTGLANRRYFREQLSRHLTQDYGTDVSLLLLDLDHFKRVNDQLGHLAGDEVLRQFARLLRNTAEEGEIMARYGGEEFAVLLPGINADEAMRVGERIRRAVEQYRWDDLSITVSVGVACQRVGETMEEDLVGRADGALYTAKDLGRNRVCSADPPMAAAAKVV